MSMEGGGVFTPTLSFSELPMDLDLDLDLMDDLLYEGCWVEATTDAFDLSKAYSSNTAAVYPLLLQHHNNSYSLESHNVPRIQQEEEFQPRYLIPDDITKRWWIPPNPSSGPFLVKHKLMEAVRNLNEYTKDKDVLIQIWVPVKKAGGRNVLTTNDQPYLLQPNSRSLKNYRNVSEAYEFAADQNSQESFGLPGRVFMDQVPEWTPDVRFFKPEEYPRVNYAQECDIRGSLALPVFERGSRTCLGVIEIVTTSQKINYRPELESICKALEAVDLSSSQSLTSSSAKASTKLYEAELTRVQECITSICKAYRLPLALTWASCAQQGKEGSRHSDENYEICVSTIDSACFVSDPYYSGFHEACSEHHLLRGQGIVGKAFVTNKLHFATDITECSKTEYPLSHHARMFELTSAVAIPLASSYSGMADFVLEFFLPKDCTDAEKQDMVLNLPRSVLWEFQDCCVPVSPTVDSGITPVKLVQKGETGRLPKQFPESESWISNIMEAQQKGKSVGVSFEFGKVPKEELKVKSEWVNCNLPGIGKMFQQNFESKPCVEVDTEDESLHGRFDLVGEGKSGQRRRTKTEKTISLEVLRQYFAGSLKDAAKSLGVCPTTLKRICRQHGINRWPSRKIKKVGHSLKKLQLVMDSVRGAEGSIQITSFYKSFPELNHNENQSVSPSQFSEPSQQLSSNLMPFEAAAEKSPSSSCTHSSSSNTSCSTGTKQDLTATTGPNCGDSHSLLWEDPSLLLKRACSDAEQHVSTLEDPQLFTRSHSQKMLNEHLNIETLPPLPNAKSHISRDRGVHRVKVTFGDENIRFSLQVTSTFRDLQEEIARRFSVEDIDRVDLKYLDDDDEWVLLTCDADLEECVDVYRMSRGRNTIRISVHQANSNPGARGSFGSSNLSQHDHLQ